MVAVGLRTEFFSDGDEEIIDYSASGTVLRSYINGGGMDEHLAYVEGTTVSYYHSDHQGSTIALSLATGALEVHLIDLVGWLRTQRAESNKTVAIGQHFPEWQP